MYLSSPRSLARFTGRNFGRITVDWESREVLLTAHDEAGVKKMEKRLKLNTMGPQGGVCDSAGQSSVGLKLVSSVQTLFPLFSNSQCIVFTVALFLVAPITIVVAVLFTALAARVRRQLN